MYSTPKRRLKPGSKFREPEPGSSSSSSSLMEPPQGLFPSKGELSRLIAVLVIASAVALFCSFIASFFDSATKPFCDSNTENSPDSLSDFCEPCPRNGECNKGMLECAHGYRRRGNLCVEDGDINGRAKKISEWVENHLCEAYAQYLCEGTGTVWVSEDTLWSDLDRHELVENFGSDNESYVYVKKMAIETIDGLLETRTTSDGTKELKCPDMLAEHYKPFSCFIHQWISNHALFIVPVSVLVIVSTFILYKVQRRWHLSARSEELYHQICDILEESALMSKRVNGEGEPWVVASQLRDHVLLLNERKDLVLWKKIEALVQEDSRIDRYPKLLKGESKVVWEWQVEGSLSSTRMRRKREVNKLMSSEGIKTNSDQQRHSVKSDLKMEMS